MLLDDDKIDFINKEMSSKEKLLQPGSFWWNFFEKVWIRVIPLRPGIVAAYSALTGAFCKAETAHD